MRSLSFHLAIFAICSCVTLPAYAQDRPPEARPARETPPKSEATIDKSVVPNVVFGALSAGTLALAPWVLSSTHDDLTYGEAIKISGVNLAGAAVAASGQVLLAAGGGLFVIGMFGTLFTLGHWDEAEDMMISGLVIGAAGALIAVFVTPAVLSFSHELAGEKVDWVDVASLSLGAMMGPGLTFLALELTGIDLDDVHPVILVTTLLGTSLLGANIGYALTRNPPPEASQTQAMPLLVTLPVMRF